jgi:hypothetical protein
MRPEDFGAVSGDPTFDSGPALNEFFRHCAIHRVHDADISGEWYTKEPIFIGHTEPTAATRAYECGWCMIRAVGGFPDPVVTIKNSPHTNFTGHLQVLGGLTSGTPPSTGESRWDQRANSECIVVGDNCSFIRFDMVSVQHAVRDGFRHEHAADNGVVSMLRCHDCGTAPHPAFQATSTIARAVNLNRAQHTNSKEQRAELTLDQLPGALNDEDFALVGGNVHAVMGVDQATSKVLLYPWVDEDPSPVGQTVAWIIGGGLVEHGGDTNVWAFDQVMGWRVGAVLKTRALYPGSYGICMAHASYANAVIGTVTDGACLGGNVDVLYSEDDVPIQVLIPTLADGISNGFSFNISSTGPSYRLDRWHRLAPNAGTGPSASRLPVTADISGYRYGPVMGAGNYLPGPSVGVGLKPVPSVVLTGEYDDTTIHLRATPGAADKFGLHSMTIHAFSPQPGPNRAPRGAWTFQPEPGLSVNNGLAGEPFVFPSFTKPGLFVCILDRSTKNWVVYNANE